MFAIIIRQLFTTLHSDQIKNKLQTGKTKQKFTIQAL